MAYKLNVWNNEPDGRLVLEVSLVSEFQEQVINKIVIPVDLIDKLTDGLKAHSCSEGDGEGFTITT